MSDARSYSKQFLTEFIQLYKSLPALWKIKCKEYSDRNKKNYAYNQMIDMLKQVEPEANRDMVIKKINSLRSSHRKEKKKIADSEKKKSGTGTEDIYVPSLWYYDMLQFVVDQETPRLPASNFDQSFSQNDNDIHSVFSPHCRNYSTLEEVYSSPPRSVSSSAPPKRSNQSERDREVESVMSSVGKRLCVVKTEDQHDFFGRSIASKLRNLPNDQRIYLEKLINEATFEAELGNLSRDCCIHVPILRPTNIAFYQNLMQLSASQPIYTSPSSGSSNAKQLQPPASCPTTVATTH